MHVYLELPALVNPELGLIFWMTLTFVIVIFLLKKFAWKPILKALQDREASIEGSLQEAENARNEMKRLKNENEAILAEARSEKDEILKEARISRDKIVADAKLLADTEAKRLIENAKLEIDKQKLSAIEELKKEVAGYSLSIAEKLVRKELQGNEAHRALIETQLSELAAGASANS